MPGLPFYLLRVSRREIQSDMEFGFHLVFFPFLSSLFILAALRYVELQEEMIFQCSSSLSKTDYCSLSALELQGSISFDAYSEAAAHDFGNVYHNRPAAVVFPPSVQDVVAVVRAAGSSSNLTVAARGHGHSINGQAQARDGVVIDMSTLRSIEVHVGEREEVSYADVSGGVLWIDLLTATLRKGLAPRSWTDYLYLTIGGTLQNAGVGGQTFKHGPQISNVLQLEVVTGNGEVITCSPTRNSDLFYGSLGGLGQFGIITKARIILEPAPPKVRWIRVLSSDLNTFTQDQELLISAMDFDYLEGFVLSNNNDPINGWTQVPFAPDRSVNPNLIPAKAGPVLYCLEVAKTYDADDASTIQRTVSDLLAPLNFIRGLMFTIDVTYSDFLNRVYSVEVTLRSLGIWQAPHPWLCLFVPRSRLEDFDAVVFKEKLRNGAGGPMLLYPMDKNKWDRRSSAVLPEEEEEDIFYLVALLRSNYPYPKGPPVESLIAENDEILGFCRTAGIHVKQYLPHFTRQIDWEHHFGKDKWKQFQAMKAKYDPRAILAPGQGIFTRNKL